MKKQQDRSKSSTSGAHLSRSGRQIATDLSVLATDLSGLKEHELDMEFASVHPIDTLLVHQLETILDREKDLRLKYSAIDPAASTPEARLAFSHELSALKDRADRLYRLMNAMEYYGPLDAHTDGLNSTAAA